MFRTGICAWPTNPAGDSAAEIYVGAVGFANSVTKPNAMKATVAKPVTIHQQTFKKLPAGNEGSHIFLFDVNVLRTEVVLDSKL